MKKIFLFVAALTLSLTSCSSDDNSGGNGGGGNSELKVTIDGVQKTFNTVVVNRQVQDGWTELTVTATIDNNPAEIITFNVDEGEVGSDVIWNFDYTKNGEHHWATNFSAVVQTNANKKLKGTFMASVYSTYDEEGQPIMVNLTNGSFDISY